jgi:hypothetical protein
MGVNLTDFGVQLTEDQKEQIREVAARRAAAARDLKATLLARFEGQKRVGVDTLEKTLDEIAEAMDAAAVEAR